MTTQDYNGWTNRETWAFNLWIDNDQGLQEMAEDYARTSLENHRNDNAEEPEAGLSSAVYCLEESLKYWAEEELFTFESVSNNEALFNVLTDIGSLYRINYREIADSMISELLQEEQVANV